MKVRLLLIPPYESLEGFDLTRYAFRVGEVYELGPRLAEVLVAYGYAAIEMRAKERRGGPTATPPAEVNDSSRRNRRHHDRRRS